LLQAQPRILALGAIHRAGRFTPLPRGAPRHRPDDVQVSEQLLARPHRYRLLFLDLTPGAEKKLRVVDHPLSHRRSAATPGGVKIGHFMGGELVVGDGLGETLAVFAFGARHRHQILHGGVRTDLAAADLLLD